MSLFYRAAYAIGFKPWEKASIHHPAAEQVAKLFDREQSERLSPYSRALDLGCGTGHWALELAARGWQVTGIDLVPRAIKNAKARAEKAGAKIDFVEGDVTALRAAGIRPEFEFIWDFGTLHGLTKLEREAASREITAVAAAGATMLMLVWTPGWRPPLPRGMSRADVEAMFSEWTVIEESEFDVSGLPPLLRRVDPRCYRLRRV
ncbi:MAG: class I SAM-dependent methyltransferase [Sphingobacteriales bacterium]|jgi:SAM-dependent methyltransferase